MKIAAVVVGGEGDGSKAATTTSEELLCQRGSLARDDIAGKGRLRTIPGFRHAKQIYNLLFGNKYQAISSKFLIQPDHSNGSLKSTNSKSLIRSTNHWDTERGSAEASPRQTVAYAGLLPIPRPDQNKSERGEKLYFNHCNVTGIR